MTHSAPREHDQMQRLRSQYGSGPVQLKVLAGRKVALLVDPADVHRALNETPDSFSSASLEKRGALNHFQPGGALVSSVNARKKRRPFNEAALQTGRTVHSHGGASSDGSYWEIRLATISTSPRTSTSCVNVGTWHIWYRKTAAAENGSPRACATISS